MSDVMHTRLGAKIFANSCHKSEFGQFDGGSIGSIVRSAKVFGMLKVDSIMTGNDHDLNGRT